MTNSAGPEAGKLPLAGIRVVEFSHMIMGPACGMMLADLGADVVKVEPVSGDNTRSLPGLAAGFFRTFNRNKRSLAVDLDRPEGLALVKTLVADADIVIENFRPGRMQRYGLDYASLSIENVRLIYLSMKGFLPGPYEARVALDEVVQMMGGLAYMTGPAGRPLRAGSSVNDIMGGIFGALGILAALRTRDATGHGQEIQSGLFENCALLSAQHMQQFDITGEIPPPMPDRTGGWAVYDIFDVADGEQLFLAVVSDSQWRIFCREFGLDDLANDERLTTNTLRTEARSWLIPYLRDIFIHYDKAGLAAKFAEYGLPFAPINRPDQLLDDPHLIESGGLVEMRTETGGTTRIPLLPLTFDGAHLGVRTGIPAIGEHGPEILAGIGYSKDAQLSLADAGIVAFGQVGRNEE